MGTRSLTHVKDEDGNTLVTIYRQMDGYPTGHGAELVEILKKFEVVNGISLSADPGEIVNGFGCLAASLIKQLKEGPGSIYIYPPNAKDCWEEYVYTIYPDPKDNFKVCLKCETAEGKLVFDNAVRAISNTYLKRVEKKLNKK